MTPADIALLQGLIRHESRSLLQYASEAYAWSKPADQPIGIAVRAMAEAEAASVTRLARWLAKQHAPLTFPGAYPMQFTTMNFVAVRYLLPKLAGDEKQRIAEAEKVSAALPAGAGRNLLDELIGCLRRNLQRLTELQTPAAIAS